MINDDNFTYSFESEAGEADWSMLAAHNKRGAVFLVSANLDLQVVAKALAVDDVVNVKSWLDSKDLIKPEEDLYSKWEEDKYKKQFNFYIVQPYVLIQLIS